ncbi:hypothetical protein DFQ28_004957 [Apophysomyces sp. BC1034]|nr:hypothetical protein DFQ28_004957 [Apophysomyces sp. BC1034]
MDFTVQHEHTRKRVCIRLDIRIELPSTSTLDSLKVMVTNNNVVVEKNMKFRTSLALTTANGNIVLYNTTAASLSLDSIEGNIFGRVHQLENSFQASTLNGNIDFVIASISQRKDNAVMVKASVSSGGIDIQLPETFDSQFDLRSGLNTPSAMFVRKDKETHTEAMGDPRHIRGYYGGNTNNMVKLSTVSGNVSLAYSM